MVEATAAKKRGKEEGQREGWGATDLWLEEVLAGVAVGMVEVAAVAPRLVRQQLPRR